MKEDVKYLNDGLPGMDDETVVQLTAGDLRTFAEDVARKMLDGVGAKRHDGDISLMTTDDAAMRLGLSTATLWRLRKEGTLTAVKIGGALRYRREDVERFLKRCAKNG